MNVPIEAVRAGKAEEYVRLAAKKEEALEALDKAEDVVSECTVKLRDIIAEKFKIWHGYELRMLSDTTVWLKSLALEEASKQLTEAAGRLMDARAAYKQAKIDFEKINREVF